MNDLVAILELSSELSAHGIQWTGGNFEDLYAVISTDGSNRILAERIEAQVRAYFEDLRLPAVPTLYDHLVLSMRSKDVIATFNWDPFLFDACARNSRAAPLPHTLFLHGNVRIGYCPEDRTAGASFLRCPSCSKPFHPSKLLFPTTEKNYADDTYIGAQWRALRTALKGAYMLTVFGYGAPQSDVEAVSLMKEAWGPAIERNLEEIEIIDIKSREELKETWSPFIHTHHYRTYHSLYDSWMASYPRRSCEAMWRTLMENNPARPAAFPGGLDFHQLWAWLEPLVAYEGRQPD
jgi:hypothetical protein